MLQPRAATLVLEKVASQRFPKLQSHPYLRTAEVKLQLSSPAHRVENGLCKFLSNADLIKLSSDKMAPDAQMAEGMMKQARVVIEKLGNKLDDANRVHVLGKFDTRLVAHLLSKGKHTTEALEFPDLQTIGKVILYNVMC